MLSYRVPRHRRWPSMPKAVSISSLVRCTLCLSLVACFVLPLVCATNPDTDDDGQWTHPIDDATDTSDASSFVPFSLAKPLSVEVDESDFGFNGFSSEDISQSILTTRAPEYVTHAAGNRKSGQRRRLRQRKGKNGKKKQINLKWIF